MTTPSLFDAGPRAAMAPRPAPTTSGPFIHLCAAPGCTAWGAYGIGVFRAVAGTWWCVEHKHLGERSA